MNIRMLGIGAQALYEVSQGLAAVAENPEQVRHAGIGFSLLTIEFDRFDKGIAGLAQQGLVGVSAFFGQQHALDAAREIVVALFVAIAGQMVGLKLFGDGHREYYIWLMAYGQWS